MKIFFALFLVLGTASVVVPATEAKTADSSFSAISGSASPQVPWNRGRGRNRRARVVTTTRITRFGFRVYRETVRITYFPNGRTTTQVVRRVRIR
ncbi:MAG TPA: hypothetical protein VGQ55_01370 [Pyrinomonadaceae bacterium]|nr:hypothetical protein [Pyrinomonadaceae bacterium]